MHPVIPYFERVVFHIPLPGSEQTLNLHGFGILVATGFLAGSWLAQRRARRDGLDPEVINRMLGWLVAGVFIGGHLGHALFYEPERYLRNPIEFLKVWQGLSSFGGFVVTAFFAWWFLRRNRLPFWPYADAIAYGLTLGWFLGRMGCFVAHDHPGLESNFWLAVPGMCGIPASMGVSEFAECCRDQDWSCCVACHDLGLYEALFSLGLLGLFVVLDRKPRFPGFYLGWMVLLYGPVRFAMDFLRYEDERRYLGLTPAQYGAALLIPVGLWILLSRRHVKPVRQEYLEARAEVAESQP